MKSIFRNENAFVKSRFCEFIFPIVHFLLSFIYERRIFIFKNNFDFVPTQALNNCVSDSFELAIGYCFSKLFGGIFILLLWHLLFVIVLQRIKPHIIVIFGLLFLVGLAGVLILWPIFTWDSIDTYMVYAYAIRFVPEYWHSFFSGCIIAGCLMVFPHVLIIVVLEWFFFCFSLGYIFFRIDSSPVIRSGWKYSVFLILFTPNLIRYLTDPFRPEIYAIIAVLYFGLIFIDIIEKKKRSRFRLIIPLCLATFLTVFRREGLVWAPPSFIAAYVFAYRDGFKKAVSHAILFVACLLLFIFPGKIGEKKYYGNDYVLITTFDVAADILNNPKGNFNYDSFEDDLEIVDKVLPLPILKQYGIDGFRMHNYASGRKDFNQSATPSSDATAYRKAYLRLVIHNIPTYLKHQYYLLSKALAINSNVEINTYKGEDLHYPSYSYDLWKIGVNDYYSSTTTLNWANNATHLNIAFSFLDQLEKYRNFWYDSNLIAIFNIGAVVVNILIVLLYIINCIVTKKPELGPIILGMSLLCLFFGVALTMPTFYSSYFRAYYYCTFIYIILFIPTFKTIKKRS